jgi:large subunit ribosomal protein L29
MNIKEMREKDEEALTKELGELYKAGFSLRMQHATQQLSNTSELKNNRRQIARVKTVLQQKADAK